ncbi:tryptophanyl-tRNA synthetase [Beutenbergia cavernae DSM 12333]|uniref:Tryptophan--tRNA ligase n=1 Tax=Beutenbergia cavernae (strain ATCC BAA-8 / DSM 12333 / CCUG 43141 / JCM 11478 / NBRC 16432 / NCIMB 13614 / HKI 0122) TaxID=471853 RepID=C5C1Y1_BEUC1|nr:tryptophan--tRNA ligase [Beutenbergia cavernae]ACQ79599.1 tryptophanyl-tRNA synthetase [Beutenbergia cavernae DSM 12333]
MNPTSPATVRTTGAATSGTAAAGTRTPATASATGTRTAAASAGGTGTVLTRASDVVGDHAESQRSLLRARARSTQLEAEIAADAGRFRVLTGDRPTGRLHLGHYLATLRSRVRLQELGVRTFVVIADYQVITDRDAPGPVRDRVLDLVADYLALGLDPGRTTIFAHSQVPELNELMLPFLSLVTDAELRRNPTVKSELADSGGRPFSGLLLTYPVHQAADILFCGANLVPVGKDQLPHLELARTIARRFAERYGDAGLVAPEALLTDAPHVLGLDGRKMSKSRGNAVELAMSADQTAALVRSAVTDPDRVITFDPVRRPEVANLLLVGALCSGRTPTALAEEIGGRGAGALKTFVTEAVNSELAPLRRRRAELVRDPGALREVLRTGNGVARELAADTLARVHAALGMVY